MKTYIQTFYLGRTKARLLGKAFATVVSVKARKFLLAATADNHNYLKNSSSPRMRKEARHTHFLKRNMMHMRRDNLNLTGLPGSIYQKQKKICIIKQKQEVAKRFHCDFQKKQYVQGNKRGSIMLKTFQTLERVRS